MSSSQVELLLVRFSLPKFSFTVSQDMLKPTTLDLHRGEFESKQMVGSLDVKKITHDLIPFAFILTLTNTNDYEGQT